MAKLTKIFVSGSIGNVTFYEFRGKPCAKIKPSRVRQTDATKESAKLFGKACAMSAVLRSRLNKMLPDPKDKKMMYALNNALLQWMRKPLPAGPLITKLRHIHKLPLNEEAELKHRMPVEMNVDWQTPGKVIVSIPSVVPKNEIRAPKHTVAIKITMTVTGCRIDKPTEKLAGHTSTIEMVYNDTRVPAAQIELPFTVEPGIINIVAASVKYFIGDEEEVMVRHWRPAEVIGSCFLRS